MPGCAALPPTPCSQDIEEEVGRRGRAALARDGGTGGRRVGGSGAPPAIVMLTPDTFND